MPEFKIVIVEDGEEFTREATDPYFAAMDFAEWVNIQWDYCLMDDTMQITVDGVPYVISAEPDISYSVREVKS